MHNPKQCPRCLFTEDIATIGETQCNYCDLQDQLRSKANPAHWRPMLEKIKKAGHGRQYDCLVGISGGEDSSVLLYLAVKIWNLRVLAIHFDNRTNRPEADHNILFLVNKLGVPFIRYYVDEKEYNDLTDAFLMAGVPDADIPNDIAMAKLMDSACKQYGIKYILNGHDFRREGSSPAAWSYMDALYVQSVYETQTGKKLNNYPLYTFTDQILAALVGIKQVRPFHYGDHNRAGILSLLKELGWQDYGGKHNENIYTAFVGNYLLPRKFKIDKRRTYLSAQMREGMISRTIAEKVLETPPQFNKIDLGHRRDRVMSLVSSPIGSRNDYDRYNFKKWKPLIWLLAFFKIVPYTFYVKYCHM